MPSSMQTRARRDAAGTHVTDETRSDRQVASLIMTSPLKHTAPGTNTPQYNFQPIPSSTSIHLFGSLSTVNNNRIKAINTDKMQNLLFASLLQLCMATLAFAAPVAHDITAQKTDAWQYGTGGGVIGLIVLVLDIIVFGKRPAPDAFSFRSVS